MKRLVVVNEKMLCSLPEDTAFRACSQDHLEEAITVLDVHEGAEHVIGTAFIPKRSDRIRLAVKSDICRFQPTSANTEAIIAQYENRASTGELCGIALQLREDFKQSVAQFQSGVTLRSLYDHMRLIDYDYQVIRGLLMSEGHPNVIGLYTGDISSPCWTSMQIAIHNAEALAESDRTFAAVEFDDPLF